MSDRIVNLLGNATFFLSIGSVAGMFVSKIWDVDLLWKLSATGSAVGGVTFVCILVIAAASRPAKPTEKEVEPTENV